MKADGAKYRILIALSSGPAEGLTSAAIAKQVEVSHAHIGHELTGLLALRFIKAMPTPPFVRKKRYWAVSQSGRDALEKMQECAESQ